MRTHEIPPVSRAANWGLLVLYAFYSDDIPEIGPGAFKRRFDQEMSGLAGLMRAEFFGHRIRSLTYRQYDLKKSAENGRASLPIGGISKRYNKNITFKMKIDLQTIKIMSCFFSITGGKS